MKSIEEMFYSKSTEDEEQFRSRTMGLVSMETYKRHISDIRRGIKPENVSKKTKIIPESKPKKMKYNTLSFEFNQGDDIPDQIPDKEDRSETISKEITLTAIKDSLSGENKSTESLEKHSEFDFSTIGKDTSIDTSFLPDKKRELEEAKAREKLKQEEFEKEEKLKQEIIEVVFSYWDGSGHRRSVHVPRNTTIGEFLEKCRIKLKSEFKEFSRLSSASLMYIKEDVILPHTITFHELIKTKARGKSGPLFHFNVFDDIREKSDVSKETTESHAGKVVKRQWYEKNKHVFPAYRWENYVPGKFNKPYSMKGD
ncbi:XAP5 protein [Cryptosporidium parvum]|uniref:Cgd1_2950 protein n=1 Tax=Cryptosporidium parvum TaxID=5807 RepID=F0X3K8_CRYPV|nr:XAP5 protein [Cryptosporidium parvum]WKS76199.1 hypothetical protein CPCDC_1g2950 [Cryptosporidium sp. 43IA8]WRK30691.1 XAP5 protein [Cryptosporidium parvum]|eukprot:QOY43329.1 hypothetical protein CPATCC_000106 [Cryptosporidium parvum]